MTTTKDEARDAIVVTLVREGIDKHKARGLASHFATLCRADLETKLEDHTALCVKRVAEVTKERNALRAEVERLKESLEAEQVLCAMRKGMVDGLIERRRLDKESMKAADGKGYVFP
jgi:hypothetical protein